MEALTGRLGRGGPFAVVRCLSGRLREQPRQEGHQPGISAAEHAFQVQGGTVWVESGVGGARAFTVLLPAGDEWERAARTSGPQSALSPSLGSGSR
jgi:hypothetical protein